MPNCCCDETDEEERRLMSKVGLFLAAIVFGLGGHSLGYGTQPSANAVVWNCLCVDTGFMDILCGDRNFV